MDKLESIDSAADVARFRLTLDLSPRLNAVVQKLAESKGISKADVLRNAVEFLDRATAASEDGMLVGAWKEDKAGNRKEREFVGL